MSTTIEKKGSIKLPSPRLLVIDAYAVAYRAYYALQGQNLNHPITGMPTHAIHGFFRMFFRLLLQCRPEHCVVAWDSPGPTFRNQLYTEYKATRKPMPDDLRMQIEEIKAMLKENGFCNLEAPGYEADDVMGSLAQRFGQTENVILFTSDKDCYQLLGKKVIMLKITTGATEFTQIDPAWVKKELGIRVDQITDYMGLIGDTSDNIPGVQGIGPKSAAKLLHEYDSLKKIYARLDSITPQGIRLKLQTDQEQAFFSRELATIKTELAEISALEPKQIQTPDFLKAGVLSSFQKEGYNQIYLELKKAKEESGYSETELESLKEVSYQLVTCLNELKQALARIKKQMGKQNILALDTETTGRDAMQARIVGISLCARPKDAVYISLSAGTSLFGWAGLMWEEAAPLLKAFLEDPKLQITGQNIKYDYVILQRLGIKLPPPRFDTMIASYLCNPTLRRHSLDDMARDVLGYEKIAYKDLVGKGSKQVTLEEIPPEKVCDYACEDADITLRLRTVFEKNIREHELERVYNEIELPLIPTLINMEQEGVAIDRAYFERLAQEYSQKLEKLREEVYRLAGYSFNLHSTRELQKVLFEELNLPKGRKTKSGYSTDQDVLESLSGLHPLVDNILEHRKYSKLNSTYVEVLPRLTNPQTGRIHTSFNQTIAATGRLSSVNPNLQNIPIREDTGRAIRRGFIPRSGNVLISMDYSQIELRIMAHYTDDPALIEAFAKEGKDIHAATAASLFGVPEEKVDADMRAHAKTVNFSIIYGVTEFGLARNLGVGRGVAADYIQKFFTKYAGVRQYMDNIIAFAEENGYIRTLSGRIRQIPNIKDSNRFRREGAQRTAINSPIQGTSADIIKIAMIDIDRDIREKKLAARMILQVHDELLFDVPVGEEQQLMELARKRMEEAIALRVPLVVECASGRNWDEAH